MTNLSAICSTVILGSLNKALATVISSKELNLWRAYTEHGMHNDGYLKLAQEIQQERTSIENALQSCTDNISNPQSKPHVYFDASSIAFCKSRRMPNLIAQQPAILSILQ